MVKIYNRLNETDEEELVQTQVLSKEFDNNNWR